MDGGDFGGIAVASRRFCNGVATVWHSNGSMGGIARVCAVGNMIVVDVYPPGLPLAVPYIIRPHRRHHNAKSCIRDTKLNHVFQTLHPALL